MENKTLVIPNPRDTHSPVENLILRPIGFFGVLLAFVATLALMAIPPFQYSYSGPPGPVEMRAGTPLSK
jgi:hypothetical protein